MLHVGDIVGDLDPFFILLGSHRDHVLVGELRVVTEACIILLEPGVGREARKTDQGLVLGQGIEEDLALHRAGKHGHPAPISPSSPRGAPLPGSLERGVEGGESAATETSNPAMCMWRCPGPGTLIAWSWTGIPYPR